MVVRCIRILDANSKPVEHSTWLTLGQDYRALQIVTGGNETLVRVVTDDGTPALCRLDEFEVVDDRIPPGWVCHRGHGGGSSISLGFGDFVDETFWSRYFDSENEALRTFHDYLDSQV